MDVKLKVTPTLVNITAKNAEVLIEELDRFETQMSMQGVKTWKQFDRLFATAITDDKVLKWLEGRFQTEPGATFRRNAYVPQAHDYNWAVMYRFARGVLAERVGLQWETPGERITKVWESIMFPDKATYEGIDAVLD